ncbi:unnamed protein product [Spirodela intermedia]|uniref:non-specific serine/threonine protein kinase n=1 Tax=Spirodela intermedia TaxID=51605 RepID=A0A7I8IBA5_SPIIN|nr:unnamed protein product [Spirodela intermedia]CAA6654858.1 unnamed protein product [Spirodela intermedia]
MGNKIAKTTQVSASEYYLHDLPSSYNLVFIESLGHDRLFKSIRCKHDEGEVIVKVYFKRGDSLGLKEHERRLSEIREILRRFSTHMFGPSRFLARDGQGSIPLEAIFLQQPHDRLSTRPFLSHVEKKWLAFQLLCAVKQSHENGVCHGDIKCENVLVTSWNWLYLADFASFKPTYIPVDDPSDFSFFFHTGGRRRCYLAPERFYEHGGEMQAAPDAPLKSSMDIFSLGCAIAELFLDGQPLFEYSQLLAYRRGQYDPCQHLEKITDTGIRKMILHMIQLDPELRLSCESYLQEYGSVVFPSYFSPFLHKVFSCLVPLDSDSRPIRCIYVCLVSRSRSNLSCEGMVLIASLLCSCIRSVKQPHMRRGAVFMLLHSSLYIDDEDRLQHVLPYVIAMLSDTSAIVRCAALETLSNILPLIRDFPPSDAKIFPEYILPMLSMLPHDQEESVRICYASNIFKIALAAYRFLICSQGLSDFQSLDKLNLPPRSVPHSETTANKHRDAIDAQILQLRRSIAEVVQELVMGPKQTPTIRRALLLDVGQLCYFFGQRQSNDFLLPILPAFLNDRDEQLRAIFYGHIVFVCFFVGQRSVEEYLLPYIEQGLSDGMEAVIVNALQCLTMLCKSGFLRKRILLDMIEKAFPLLCYPIQWVRRSTVSFIAASSESLGLVDSHVYLSPVLRPFLHREPTSLSSEASLLSCLKPPVSKSVFYKVLESARSSDMLERQRKIWYNTPASSKQWEDIENTNKVARDQNTRKKESNVQDKKHSNTVTQKLIIPDSEDTTKSRVTGGSLHNFPSMVDGRDPLSSEKMQFSGFISPHVSAGNSLVSDGQSEGIPVYSLTTVRHPTGAEVTSSETTMLQWNSSGTASISSPLADPSNRQFGLSTSGPPKLVSGSFLNINNGSQRIKFPKEPEEKENDQSGYITSRFRDITVADTLKGSSSMTGEDAAPQGDATGLPSFARATSIPEAEWRVRGVLVAHLQEHRSAVNDIAVSIDHSFFVTASDDSTVKIWDTRKLEKDISFRSRLTYPLDGNGNRALCTAMLHGGSQVAVGACCGTIHIFSVDYVSKGLGSVVERYSGIADIKKKDDGEGAVISLLNCSVYDGSRSQMLLYSTQYGGVHLWDTRTNFRTWTFKCAPDEGYVSTLTMAHLVIGLFLLPVNSWQYSAECPIEDMCLFIPPINSAMPASGKPLVYVAAGCNEVSLWNAENGSCHQVLRLAAGDGDAENSSNVPWALRKPSGKSSMKQAKERNGDPKYRIDEFNEPPSRLSGVRSLLPLPGGNLLTGGTDLKIRYWDHQSASRSYCICGPSAKGIGCDEQYNTRSCFGVQLVQELLSLALYLAGDQQAACSAEAEPEGSASCGRHDTAGCHRDSVLSMAAVKMNQRLLISGSRDGAIKVWK